MLKGNVNMAPGADPITFVCKITLFKRACFIFGNIPMCVLKGSSLQKGRLSLIFYRFGSRMFPHVKLTVL